VQVVSPSGDVLDAVELDVTVAPRSKASLVLPPGYGSNGLVVATAAPRRAVHGQPGVDRQLIRPQWDLDVVVHDSWLDVTVTATTLVRDLCMFADRVDPQAAVDEQLVTLLPGEAVTLRVSSAAPDRAAWTERLRPGGSVLRAVGDRRSG
jgi:beta-mannosidase